MFLCKVKNDVEGRLLIDTMRKNARGSEYKISVRGRCKNRKAVFSVTGKHYSKYSANVNDIYYGSKEAPYCYEWAIYVNTKTV